MKHTPEYILQVLENMDKDRLIAAADEGECYYKYIFVKDLVELISSLLEENTKLKAELTISNLSLAESTDINTCKFCNAPIPTVVNICGRCANHLALGMKERKLDNQ